MCPCFASNSRCRNAIVRCVVCGFLVDVFIDVRRGNSTWIAAAVVSVSCIRNYFIF